MRQYWQEKYLRFVGMVLLALFMAFFMKDIHEPTVRNVFVSIGITVIMWEGNRFVLFRLRKFYPQIKQTTKRLLVTAICIVLYILMANFIIKVVLAFTEWGEPLTLYNIFKHIRMTSIATLVVVITYESHFFFSQWKATIIEKESLKHQQVRSQFAALKNQISPHFLFNSLNTLVTLIAENQDLAIEFTQKLSEVYRYILQNKEKEVVTLQRELDFTDSYIFLLKMRFAENLQIAMDIPNEFLQDCVAPLSLQMLIENAIKHNEVSTAKPLAIHISVQNGSTLVVKNKLQRKRMVQHSTKTGLENIRKRYQHLSNQPVEVITTATNFIVALPLLKVSHEAPVLD